LTTPWLLAVSGTNVYVTEKGANDVAQFTSTGSTLTKQGTTATGIAPIQILIAGSHAYVTNSADNTVSEYTVSSANGNLSPLSSPVVGTGATPTGLASDSGNNNMFLVVADS